MSIETQRAPSPTVGLPRVRIEAGYMSQFQGNSRTRESANSDSQMQRQGQPFRLIAWVGPGGRGSQGFASPRKTGAPLTTPPARPKQTEIGGMAVTEFREVKKKNFLLDTESLLIEGLNLLWRKPAVPGNAPR